VVYNSGRFRMAGRGSLAGLLPFADANAIVLEMANEVLPVSSSVKCQGPNGPGGPLGLGLGIRSSPYLGVK
jgi:predicted TIM-barrel enzyme